MLELYKSPQFFPTDWALSRR